MGIDGLFADIAGVEKTMIMKEEFFAFLAKRTQDVRKKDGQQKTI